MCFCGCLGVHFWNMFSDFQLVDVKSYLLFTFQALLEKKTSQLTEQIFGKASKHQLAECGCLWFKTYQMNYPYEFGSRLSPCLPI